MTPAEKRSIDRHIEVYVDSENPPLDPWPDVHDDQFYADMAVYLKNERFTWYEQIGLTEQEAFIILKKAEISGFEVTDPVRFCSETAMYLEDLYKSIMEWNRREES